LGGQIFALLVLQFLATFEILLSGLGTTRKHHKSFSCNFLGVNPHFDSTTTSVGVDELATGLTNQDGVFWNLLMTNWILAL